MSRLAYHWSQARLVVFGRVATNVRIVVVRSFIRDSDDAMDAATSEASALNALRLWRCTSARKVAPPATDMATPSTRTIHAAARNLLGRRSRATAPARRRPECRTIGRPLTTDTPSTMTCPPGWRDLLASASVLALLRAPKLSGPSSVSTTATPRPRCATREVSRAGGTCLRFRYRQLPARPETLRTAMSAAGPDPT